MAVTSAIYGKSYLALYNKEIDYDSDDIRVSLHTSTYTPDQDADDYFNDASNEITGTGYTAGGVALANKTITYTGATNIIKLDADDSSWASSTLTARYAVIYDRTPSTDATRPLMGYQNFGANVVSTGGTFSIVWSASGLFQVTIGAEA